MSLIFVELFFLIVISLGKSVNYKGKCVIPKRYDYIIVGAGVSGSIVASELSKKYSVLLIEEGGWSSQWDVINDGSRAFETLSEPQIERSYFSTPQPNVYNRIFPQPRARVTGGCGSHTGLQFALGQRADFDERWRNIDGWKWDDLEIFWQHITDTYNTTQFDIDNWISTFINVAQNNGYTFVEDTDDLSNLPNPPDIASILKISGSVTNDGTFGKRTSAWNTYIEPILGTRDNLDVLVYTRVNKILFKDNKRYKNYKKPQAIGVETYGIGDHKINQFIAKKEVILSAGTMDSPKILMLSGIGDCGYLTSLGIECISNVPAVGKHLEDHLDYGLASPPLKDQSIELPELFNFNNYGIHLLLEEGRFRNGLSVRDMSQFDPALPPPTFAILAICNFYQLHSRGEILLKDNNPESLPIINPNYLSDLQDEQILIDGFRQARKLLYDDMLMPLYIPGAPELNPGFEVQTDEEILEAIKQSPFLNTGYHPGSTCKMGNKFSKDNLNDIVVNNQLQVRGVKKLRIIDHSIAPNVVSANTNQVSMLIGFKGADIILNDNGY